MFELYVARKYLLPRRHSFSTVLVSFLSILVISLVVWLILVFLSVTAGIEKKWLERLTALHAPIRIAPTSDYYASYYYRIDQIAAVSNYCTKTIGEKMISPVSDPYDPEVDREVPRSWNRPDRLADGSLKDPVQRALKALFALQKEDPSLRFQDYEMSGALVRIDMARNQGVSTLSQVSYLLSEMEQNPAFASLIVEAAEGEGLLLPKGYRDNGVQIGDLANVSFASPISSQEQRIQAKVKGFYDPGLLPLGNRCLIAPKEITRMIQSANPILASESMPTNGFFVWFDDLDKTSSMEKKIQTLFDEAGIGSYWQVTPYEKFEFAKDLIQQFKSDKTLFMLIAALILLVASCNIITLLILLIHDKRKEVAILQSMGASPKSIAAIFALCGIAMGGAGSLIGLFAAFLTLKNLDSLIHLLSILQGGAAFHPAFFNSYMPSQMSWEAILFVVIATPLASLLSGLIAAYKALRIRLSTTLRPE